MPKCGPQPKETRVQKSAKKEQLFSQAKKRLKGRRFDSCQAAAKALGEVLKNLLQNGRDAGLNVLI